MSSVTTVWYNDVNDTQPFLAEQEMLLSGTEQFIPFTGTLSRNMTAYNVSVFFFFQNLLCSNLNSEVNKYIMKSCVSVIVLNVAIGKNTPGGKKKSQCVSSLKDNTTAAFPVICM